jgi:hypothetical protein
MNRIKYTILLVLTLAAAAIPIFAQDPDIDRLGKIVRLIEKVNAIPVEFKIASPELTVAGAANVRKQAALLKQLPPGTTVEIGVHTFAVGDEPKNVNLTQTRAEKVRNALVTAGVPTAGLTAKGYGSSKPVTSKAADSRNRRVEYLVIKSAQPAPAANRLNLAGQDAPRNGPPIVAGKGWGNVRVGSSRADVEDTLGKPEFFENSGFPPNESYGSYYRKGMVIVYETKSLRATHLRFIGDGPLYGSGSATFWILSGQPG